jgi:hypothetical protein
MVMRLGMTTAIQVCGQSALHRRATMVPTHLNVKRERRKCNTDSQTVSQVHVWNGAEPTEEWSRIGALPPQRTGHYCASR